MSTERLQISISVSSLRCHAMTVLLLGFAATPNAVWCSRNLAGRVSPWKGCTNADCPFAGTWLDSNVLGSSSAQDPEAPGVYPTKPFDIDEMVRDPWNHDFRACPGSPAAAKGAGAYAAWSPADKSYLIPGAKRWAASQPSPKAHDAHARLDAELLFLGNPHEHS